MDNGASSYRRFLDGEENAFDEILTAYRDSLTFFIIRYVGDAAEAEDLAIDTFMDLLVHRHRYNFKIPLKNYLFMIARSKSIDHLRRRSKLKKVALDEIAELPSDEDTPEEALLRDERKKAVNSAMAKLSDEMRIAVHLVYFEELSYKETAQIMKKKEKQIDNLLYRAKGELRTLLTSEGEM